MTQRTTELRDVGVVQWTIGKSSKDRNQTGPDTVNMSI